MKTFPLFLIGSFFLFVSFLPPMFQVPEPGFTGAPGEQTCVTCHTGTPLNGGPGNVSVVFNNGNNHYQAGHTYNVAVTTTDATMPGYSFQITVLDSTNHKAGKFMLIDTSNTALGTKSGRIYVSANHSTSLNTWHFKWKAPAAAAYGGTIKFYAVGLGDNLNNHPTGDHVYSSNISIVKNGMREENMASAVSCFTVYPNPAKENVNVKFRVQAGENVQLTLLNSAGQVMSDEKVAATEGLNSFSFAVKNFPAGIYFVKLNGNNETQVQKLMITQ